MAEEGTETPAVETPQESEVVAEETDTESTGQDKEESPASDESESQDKTDAEPETAKGSDSEKRATETAKQQAIELRQLKRQLRQMQGQMQSPKVEMPKVTEPQRPLLENYSDVEVFEKDHKEWLGKHDEYVKQIAIQERLQKERKDSEEKQRKADMDSWTKRETDTRKRIPDYGAVQEIYQEVDPTPIMDGFLMESDIGPDILWHLRENPDVAEEIRTLTPFKAARALIKLEDTLSNQIKGIKPKPTITKPPQTVKEASAAGPAKKKSAADLLYGT